MPQYIKRFPNALPAGLCKRLIEKFKNVTAKPDPQPLYSGRKFVYISRDSNWETLEKDVLRYSSIVMRRYFRKPGGVRVHARYDVPDQWANDGFVLARYDVGDTCALHYDGQISTPPHNQLRIATLLFYLNGALDGGGETLFPLQQLAIKPETGKAIVFPVTFSYPHEALPARSPRYILQTWITDPEYEVLQLHGAENGTR